MPLSGCVREFLRSMGIEALGVLRSVLVLIKSQLQLALDNLKIEEKVVKFMGTASSLEVELQKNLLNALNAFDKVRSLMPIDAFRDCEGINNLLRGVNNSLDVLTGGVTLFQSLTDRAKIVQFMNASIQESIQSGMDTIDEFIAFIDEAISELVGQI